jgi:large subunit ribosomal protein L16
MKAFPNIQRWKFKKLHKPGFNFTKLIERKMFVPMQAQYAIQALEPGKLTFKQLEACRRALRRGLGKSVRIYFHVFTGVPVSKKPVAVRMGKVKEVFRIELLLLNKVKLLLKFRHHRKILCSL